MSKLSWRHRISDQLYRLVLSNTEDLHARLDQMSTRIHQLEDALAIAHRRYDTDSTHPLLSDEFLSVRMGAHVENHADTRSRSSGSPEADLSRSMGTLTIDAGGKAKYYGATGTNGKHIFSSSAPLSLMAFPRREPSFGW